MYRHVLPLLVLFLTPLIQAQEKQATGNVQLTTAIYDIAEIIDAPPDKLLAGIPQYGADKRTEPNDNDKWDLAESLERLVAPSSWARQGGKGKLAIVGRQLVVWNTGAVHEELRQLLESFRQSKRHRLCITADWLFVPKEDYLRWTALGFESPRPVELEKSMLREFLDTMPSLHAEVFAVTGQTVSLLSGTQRLTVQGVVPVVSAEASALDPEFYFRSDGLALQLTPGPLQEGDRLAVETHAYLTSPNQDAPLSSPFPGGVTAPTITRAVVHTTARLTLGQPALVAAVTRNPRAGKGDNRVACLILHANRLDIEPSKTEKPKE